MRLWSSVCSWKVTPGLTEASVPREPGWAFSFFFFKNMFSAVLNRRLSFQGPSQAEVGVGVGQEAPPFPLVFEGRSGSPE